MRTPKLLPLLGLMLLPCTAAIGQVPPPPAPQLPPEPVSSEPAPAPEPKQWLLQREHPFVVVGPKDAQGPAKSIKGTIAIITRPPSNLRISSVAVTIDGKPAGSAGGDRMGLFGLEMDTKAIVDGPHTIMSVGADATGKQMWSATTPIIVANNATQAKTPATAPATIKPPVAPTPKVKPAPKAATKQIPGKTYTSSKYGFWMRLPSGWTTKDKTASMKPAQAGNGWVEFSSPKAAGMVVNVRRMRLSPGTTPDTFAKFNPYVSSWTRKSILGTEGFGTDTDTGNRIIHRLIFVKNGMAWMLNCVDAYGKTSDNGEKVFGSIVTSFGVGAPAKSTAKTSAKTTAKVTVTPIARH